MEFPCSVCDAVAGTVWLEGNTQVACETFTARLWHRVEPGRLPEVRAALRDADSAALCAFDLELAPWWCAQCELSYCGAHWLRWSVFDDDGWHDSVRGRCPEGHERMLMD